MARGDYLVRVAGSQNWYGQIMYPPDILALFEKDGGDPSALWPFYRKGARKLVWATGTPDREIAKARIAERVYQFKFFTSVCRALQKGTIRELGRPIKYTQEPGTTELHEDGSRTIATKDTIIRIGPDFLPIGDPVPNVALREMVHITFDGPERLALAKAEANLPKAKPKRSTSIDQSVIDFWKTQKRVKPAVAREAERAYEFFKIACPDKTFATATRSDGRRFAEYLFDEEEMKTQTVQKMIGHLRAAVNAAMEFPDDYPSVRANPFSKVVEARDDEQTRQAFDDADMETLHSAMWSWDKEERLLWVLCATTGMRRSEAWDIQGEELIDGFRVLHYGHKTASSDRKVPIPRDLAGFLPDKITGPLFPAYETPKGLGKRLIRRIREAGITDPRKVLHSTRHRASTRMHGVQDSVRDAVLGHEDNGRGGKKRASRRYFGGHPVKTIAEAVNMIGILSL